MSTLLSVGLANAACAAALAVLALVAGRLCRRPALAHALWVLVLVKLVTPPLFRPSVAWLPAESPAPAAVEVAGHAPAFSEEAIVPPAAPAAPAVEEPRVAARVALPAQPVPPVAAPAGSA